MGGSRDMIIKIGLIGGKDITGIVPGRCGIWRNRPVTSVADVPQWIDQVYPDESIEYPGKQLGEIFTNGFINSVIGQANVIKATDGCDQLALDDDLWMYTGLSSVTADQSNIGFLLVNKRAKETRYYQINGAR